VVGRRPRSAEAATGSGGYVVDVDLLYGVFGFPERMTMEMILGTSVRMGFTRSGA
jgi:hypothetical protein